MKKLLLSVFVLLFGLLFFSKSSFALAATCTLNGQQVPVGQQFCKGASYTGQVCTSATTYGTCQDNGTWLYNNCAAGTACAYYPDQTNVSCLASCVGPQPPVCGNNSCESGESCTNCSVDCGSCPPPAPYCGDGTCNNGETCNSCSTDCGSCPNPTQPPPGPTNPQATSTPTPTKAPTACTPGATQCYNGKTGYCDMTHLYYQTCNTAGAWQNSSNCPSGYYPYAFGGNGQAGCVKPCGGHGTESCQTSCAYGQAPPTYNGYACSVAGQTCCNAAPTPTSAAPTATLTPTKAPTASPTKAPTVTPTKAPTASPTGSACVAGTGSTNASCGGHASYECQTNVCEELTYRCDAAKTSCISASHAAVAQSYCCGATKVCNNGICVASAITNPPTTTPTKAPTATPTPTKVFECTDGQTACEGYKTIPAPYTTYYTNTRNKLVCVGGKWTAGTVPCASGQLYTDSYCTLTGPGQTSCVNGCDVRGYTCLVNGASCPEGKAPSNPTYNSYACPTGQFCCARLKTVVNPTKTPTPTLGVTGCKDGTGSTNASCGGGNGEPQCNGNVCQEKGYYCKGGSTGTCTLTWTIPPGKTRAMTDCCPVSGNRCINGGCVAATPTVTPTPTNKPTPIPTSASKCSDALSVKPSRCPDGLPTASTSKTITWGYHYCTAGVIHETCGGEWQWAIDHHWSCGGVPGCTENPAICTKDLNFGDYNCTFSKNALLARLKALDPVNASYWYYTVIPCESGYKPNAWTTAGGTTPNPAGAWGLFQMDPFATYYGVDSRGYKSGNVEWNTQVANAVRTQRSNGWGYWACAK